MEEECEEGSVVVERQMAKKLAQPFPIRVVTRTFGMIMQHI